MGVSEGAGAIGCHAMSVAQTFMSVRDETQAGMPVLQFAVWAGCPCHEWIFRTPPAKQFETLIRKIFLEVLDMRFCWCSLSRLGLACRSMNQWMSLILLLVLALGFTGCQSKQDENAREVLKVLNQARAEANKVGGLAKRGQLLVSIGVLQGKAGRFDLAESTFEQVIRSTRTVSNPSLRLSLLKQVAQAQAELGLTEFAKQTFQEILKIVSQLEPSLGCSASTRHEIGVLQAQVGFHEDAIQTVQGISDSGMRLYALIEIARTHAYAGRHEELSQVIQMIEALHREMYNEPLWIDPRLLNALALARAGQHESSKALFEASLQEARLQKDPSLHTATLIEIAEYLIDADYHEWAVQTLHTALQSAQKLGRGRIFGRNTDELLGQIALGYAKTGRYNEAIRTLKEIQIPTHWVVEAGRILAEAGHTKEVLQIADQLRDVRTYKIELLEKVGVAWAGKGQFEIAHSVVKKIGESKPRAIPVLVELAKAYVQAGRLDQALRIASMQGYEDWQVSATKAIAQALAQSGQSQQALHQVARFDRPDQRAEVLIGIAEGLLGVGEADRSA